jgi:hypothetical protein
MTFEVIAACVSAYDSSKVEESLRSRKKRTGRGDAMGSSDSLHSNTTPEIPVRCNS